MRVEEVEKFEKLKEAPYGVKLGTFAVLKGGKDVVHIPFNITSHYLRKSLKLNRAKVARDCLKGGRDINSCTRTS